MTLHIRCPKDVYKTRREEHVALDVRHEKDLDVVQMRCRCGEPLRRYDRHADIPPRYADSKPALAESVRVGDSLDYDNGDMPTSDAVMEVNTLPDGSLAFTLDEWDTQGDRGYAVVQVRPGRTVYVGRRIL